MGKKVFYGGLTMLLALPHFVSMDIRIGAAVTIIGFILILLDK